MYAIDMTSSSAFNPAFDTTFQTLDAGQLADVAGGFSVGKMVDAGNAGVESGAKAGAALGGMGGAIAGMGHDLPPPLWPTLVAAITRHAERADARSAR